jgi:signal transduction histidine kinase/CheY-like chemotaxis protein
MYRQPNNSIYKTVVIVWLTLSVASVVLAAVTWLDLSQRLREARQAAAVRAALDAMLALVVDAETAQRGFSITGDESYLVPIRGAGEILQGVFDRILPLVKGDELLLKRMMELRTQAELSLGFQHRVIEARRQEGPERAVEMVVEGEGKRLVDGIRVRVREVAEMQKPVMVQELVDRPGGALFRASLTSLVAGVLGVGAGVFAFWLARVMLGHQDRERRLVEARLLAERNSREKTVFLANMSHEIRTPMNAILGFGELLAGEVVDPRHRKYVRAIHTSATSLLQLINDILDMSKIEAGVMELRLEPTDPRELCEFLHTLFAEPLARKDVRLDCAVDQELPRALLMDRIRLRQVLVNLVGNAVKFTDKGSIGVRIGGEPPSASGHITLLIEVVDTGVGIPADKLEAIFKPFVQAGAHLEREKSGTGLGLSIVRRLTETMGGTVTAASQLGQGSAFSLRIPGIAISARLPQPGKLETDGGVDFNTLCPARILVVDDNEANCKLMEGMLAGSHHQVSLANSGLEAIENARAVRPSVVLLDIRMPGMDGFETLQNLRTIPGMERIPVIAVTASGLASGETLSKGSFSGYLRKPFSRMELYDELSEFLPRQAEDALPGAGGGVDPGSAGVGVTPPELVTELRRLHEVEWPVLREVLAINECKAFAMKLSSLAETWPCPALANYARTLSEHATNYSVVELEAQMGCFPGLVERLQGNKPA